MDLFIIAHFAGIGGPAQVENGCPVITPRPNKEYAYDSVRPNSGMRLLGVRTYEQGCHGQTGTCASCGEYPAYMSPLA